MMLNCLILLKITAAKFPRKHALQMSRERISAGFWTLVVRAYRCEHGCMNIGFLGLCRGARGDSGNEFYKLLSCFFSFSKI